MELQRSVLVAVIGLAISGFASAKQPPVADRGAGFYEQEWAGDWPGHVAYYVDSVARLCFASRTRTIKDGGGITMIAIPCSNLRRRPEWQSIITWESEGPPHK